MATAKRVYQALVRNVEGEPDIIIAFLFASKLHKLCRPKDQPLEKTLQRVSLSLAKRKKGKTSTTQTPPRPAPVVSLLRNNGSDNVPIDSPNAIAWQNGAWFVIDDFRYEIRVNCPQVKKLTVPSPLMIGCPAVPQVDVEFADKDCCQWKWFRIAAAEGSETMMAVEDIEIASLDSSYSPKSMETAIPLHNGHIYRPTLDDVDHQLLLQCTPYNSHSEPGIAVYFQTTCVKNEPETKAITRRQQETQVHLPVDSLRVISYNILADQHATADYSQNILYTYCKPEALESGYRHSLLVKEILGYHPDIVCLQEVAKKCFDLSLLPVLREKGYDGVFAEKTGKLQEGEAIFFHLSKYEAVQSSVISLSQFLHSAGRCGPLLQALQGAQSVLKNLNRKPTILQTALLKVTGFSDRYLLVANTHLCFHPTEDYMRLLQAVICTRAISDVISQFKATLSDPESAKIGVLFCGDFNSCPCTGAYQYLTSGFLPRAHPDWTKYKLSLIPRCGCCKVTGDSSEYIVNIPRAMSEDNEEEIELEGASAVSFVSTDDGFDGLDVEHEFHLCDACSPLDYTHYRDVFVAVLDYILVDKDCFVVEKVIPMPSHAEVTEHIALPSVCFPSDHLALVCELKWKL